MSEDKEAFLDRWSRRKLEQVDEKPAPAPVPAPAPAPAPAKDEKDPPAVVLPRVEDLNSQSDFTPFMNPNVDGATRRSALKKLFADAHYNVPDPFEAYSEDWTVGEPIPAEMLKALNHAQKLLFEEPEKKIETAATAAPQGEDDSKDPVGKQDS